MGCRFCASTLDGWERNLLPSEMLDQIYTISRLTGERVSNVVVMGTGEPMDNYDNLLTFIRILTEEHGLHISQRNITVSTCGIVPKMKELAEEKLQITLALSLHATTDEKRRKLMPIANTWHLDELMEACAYYFEKTGRRITFEYSLVGGVNDSLEDAAQLSALAGRLNAHVNLIPVNPIKERDYRQSGQSEILAFKNKLEKNGINVTIRREMGRDIYGACGQMRRRNMSGDKDGMGGHKAGGYASSCAVETILEGIRESESSDPEEILTEAIQKANEVIERRAGEDERLSGMGTTVVAACWDGKELHTANVGDSRLYVVNGGIEQITEDHSLVQEMVRVGGINKEEARSHPNKNIITRAVGLERYLRVDCFRRTLELSLIHI